MKISRLTRDGIAETVSRDQLLRHERGQRIIHFSCSASWSRPRLATLPCCDSHTYKEFYNNGTVAPFVIILYLSHSDTETRANRAAESTARRERRRAHAAAKRYQYIMYIVSGKYYHLMISSNNSSNLHALTEFPKGNMSCLLLYV